MERVTTKPWNLTAEIFAFAVFKHCPYEMRPVGKGPGHSLVEPRTAAPESEITEAVTTTHPSGYAPRASSPQFSSLDVNEHVTGQCGWMCEVRNETRSQPELLGVYELLNLPTSLIARQHA